MILALLISMQITGEVKPPAAVTVDPLSVVIASDTEYGPALKPSDLPPRFAKIRELFDDQLIDYGSARFKRVVVGSIGPRLVVCGEVNSKNRMGGYTGWEPFVAMIPPELPPVLHILEGPLGSAANAEVPQLVFKSRCLSDTVAWMPGEYDLRLTLTAR
jgi:hypothetical protein